MMKHEIQDIVEKCYLDTALFCKVFFPHVFYRGFSPIHMEIFRILDDPSIQKAVITAPRGIGKSSIVNMAYTAKRILYNDAHFIIPLSAGGSLAIEQAENLKSELETNRMVANIFPGFESGKMEMLRDNSKEWITGSNIKILPRGAGQQIRGRRHLHYRPDVFVVDDLEEDEAVMNEDRRQKLSTWFHSAVVNTVDRGSDDWRILVIGTILHEDSLLSNLMKDPDWYSVRLDICDDNYNSKWPEFMTTEQIKALADSYRQKDQLDIFYREYRNIPIALEQQGIRPEYIKYYDGEKTELELSNDKGIDTLIMFDPARTLDKGSAKTAIMGVAVEHRTDKWYIRDIINERLYPDQVYDAVFDMARRLNATVLAPEITGLHEYIMQPLRNEMIKRGCFYPIVELNPREGKASKKRSGQLVPRYRQGLIYHNSNVCGSLETHLYQWPRPAMWDEIDCLSGVPFALEKGDKWFESAATNPDEEYDELEYEPALPDDWRRS